MSRPRVILVSRSLDGHRADFVALFTRLLEQAGYAVTMQRDAAGALSEPAPMLFLMIEEGPARFVGAAIARAVRGRRTAGLFFRPAQMLAAGGAKPRLMRALRAVPRITVCTILPFALDPRFAAVADAWIEDPQLWDLEPGDYAHDTPLAQEIVARAGGRPIVAALGLLNAAKGFDALADALAARPALAAARLIVAAGKVDAGSQAAAARFAAAGGMLVPRFVSNAELFSIYACADLLWSAYAPGYDQASGIFGRAVQFGKPVVVRRGSLVDRHAALLGACAVRVDVGDPGAIADALAAPVPRADAVDIAALRARSIATLLAALR